MKNKNKSFLGNETKTAAKAKWMKWLPEELDNEVSLVRFQQCPILLLSGWVLKDPDIIKSHALVFSMETQKEVL